MSPRTFIRRRQVWLALLALALLLPRLPADADAPQIREVLRDGTGRLWGIMNGDGGGLYVFTEDEQWQPVTLPGIRATRPDCLGRRADGAVVCLWRSGEGGYQCSEHRGQQSKAFASFVLPQVNVFTKTRLTGDSKGGMWLTQEGPNLYRLRPDGTPECPHTISAGEFLPGTYPSDPARGIWGLVSVFEDAGGRLWFWTDHADGSDNGATIRGALLYDGAKFVQRDFLMPGGKEQTSLTALAQKDAQHLWFAREFDGLYTLDTATFQAERVADQPKEASMTSRVLPNADGSWCFILGQARAEGGCTLWRLTSDHGWTKLIDGVDSHYEFYHQQDRVWTPAPHGTYLGSNDNGLWFVPGDGSPPRRLDWRQGFSLATPHRFFDLPSGRWLGVSINGVTWVGSPDALLAAREVLGNPRIRVLRVEVPLLPDARGHLWSPFTNFSKVLHEWDGDRWTEHPLPGDFHVRSYSHLFNLDARGRAWLRSHSEEKWAAIYDPALERWQIFGSFEQALEAQEGRHDAEFALTDRRTDTPRFGSEGRICYLTDRWKAAVFDGHVWSQQSGAEITGQTDASLYDAPFFNRAGRVSINAAGRTWERVAGRSWHATAFEPDEAERAATARKYHQAEEAGAPFQPETEAQDSQGNSWLTRQGMLYKACRGLCVPVFAPGEAQPFMDGRRLDAALLDARGNVFLHSRERQEYAILAPPGPPPRTTLALAPAAGADAAPDRAVVRLGSDAGLVQGKARFNWRLDGGAWQPLAADYPSASVTLDGLPAGSHRFEARSFDATLQTDAAPAALDFEVRVDPAAQVAGYIAQLADPDYARREAAAAALARQPERALPALRAARAGADESRRWWLDAAIQKAEGRRQKAEGRRRRSQGGAARLTGKRFGLG